MKKVFCIMKIARQIDGDFVYLQPEKAFSNEDPEKAEFHAMKYDKNNPLMAFEVMDTPDGKIECEIQRYIFDIEVEEI